MVLAKSGLLAAHGGAKQRVQKKSAITTRALFAVMVFTELVLLLGLA